MFERPRRTRYPAKPRSTSSLRTPFGPRNGSGIFCQYLIMIRNRILSHIIRKEAHRYPMEPTYVMTLSSVSVSICTTIDRGTCHSDPYQLSKTIVRWSQLRYKKQRRTNTHFESRNWLIQAVEQLDGEVHPGKEELRGCNK